MWSLSLRLLFLLTVALLPIGLIAVYQTFKVVQEVEEIAARDILAQTVRASIGELNLIQRAHGSAFALGTAGALLAGDEDQCDALMRNFVGNAERYVFAGFVQLNGMMSCASSESNVDFSESPEWQDFLERPRRMVTFNPDGEVSGASVIVASAPIYADDGELLGAGSVSMPHSLAESLLENEIESLEIAIINDKGEVLTTSTDSEEGTLFEALRLEPASLAIPKTGLTLNVDRNDTDLAVAIVPLVTRESYVVGRWAGTENPFSVSILGTATPLFPVIMWLMSLFVAFFAIDRLVLQYLTKMCARMADFSGDDLGGSHIRLKDAPKELNQIASSYNNMLERIANDRKELEQSVRDKDILLREVHHRVKNNLQLIASILNMQLRNIDDPEATSVLRKVQGRVKSLASIHKSLYTDENVETVRMDRLLSENIRSTINVGMPSAVGLETDISIAPVELDPDQAVPLSLLVTEAVTNAVKYVGATEGQTPRLLVRLEEPSLSEVCLTIENSCGAEHQDVPRGTGLGARLIDAFVQQLGGELEITETESSYRVDVRFSKIAHPAAQVDAA